MTTTQRNLIMAINPWFEQKIPEIHELKKEIQAITLQICYLEKEERHKAVWTPSSGISLKDFLQEYPLEDFRKKYEDNDVYLLEGVIWFKDGNWFDLFYSHETLKYYWRAHYRPNPPN